MKKTVMKCLAMCLAIILVFTYSVIVFAAEDDYEWNDTSIDVVNDDALRSVFCVNGNARGISDKMTIEAVSYDYEFAQFENEPSKAYVVLTFRITVDENQYTSSVEGTVDAYQLSSGDVLWEGPIRGNIILAAGVEYSVIAGFSKLESSPDIQVSMTIQSADSEMAISPVLFTFGEKIVDCEISQELQNISDTVNNETLFVDNLVACTSVESLDDFTYLGYKFAYFNTGLDISGSAQRATGYFCENNGRFAVAMKSYCRNVDNYFVSTGSVTTSIREFAIALTNDWESDSDGVHTYIAGVESCEEYGSTAQNNVPLLPIFEDAMGLLGIPTSTISAVLDGLTGTVAVNHFTNSTSVDITFGLLEYANFDDCTKGVPIIFQLAKYSNDVGTTPYTFKTSITYRAIYTPTGATNNLYYYIDGYDASKSVEITIG